MASVKLWISLSLFALLQNVTCQTCFDTNSRLSIIALSRMRDFHAKCSFQAPAETSPPPARSTTVNPLNKLRNRNRLQVHPKTTTRTPVPLASRRSPLLPRRKVTEAPIAQTSQEEISEEPDVSSETEPSETASAETSTAASTKHEETRGLSGLLAPRRRIAPRRPGQIISRE